MKYNDNNNNNKILGVELDIYIYIICVSIVYIEMHVRTLFSPFRNISTFLSTNFNLSPLHFLLACQTEIECVFENKSRVRSTRVCGCGYEYFIQYAVMFLSTPKNKMIIIIRMHKKEEKKSHMKIGMRSIRSHRRHIHEYYSIFTNMFFTIEFTL